MSLKRVRLNNLSTQKVSGRSLRLSRLSRKRFPFPSAAAAPIINYIEDVFSTYLYAGTGSSQTIVNGIDLSGKGGMTWFKVRSAAGYDNAVVDSARGVSKILETNLTNAEATQAAAVTSYNSNGFTLGTDGGSYGTSGYNINPSGISQIVSWTFRKQPKFFDVVTYTGDGSSSKQVSHNLQALPGFVAIKRRDSTGNWICVARYSGTTRNDWFVVGGDTLNGDFGFNQDIIAGTGTSIGGGGIQRDMSETYVDVARIIYNPTTALFDATKTNGNGNTYVMYLFAHDAGGFGATGTESVIKCGTFDTTVGNYVNVNLGWEPQFVLLKRIDGTVGPGRSWNINDNMRGFDVGFGGPTLFANDSGADSFQGLYGLSGGTSGSLSSTGFGVYGQYVSTWIYIAIRRGPMRTPTSGTSVYDAITYTGNGIARSITGLGFPLDLNITGIRDNGSVTVNGTVTDRLRGGLTTGAPRLFTTSTSADWADSTSITTFDLMNGYKIGGTDGTVNSTLYTYVSWNFRRAPGFFDVVCYTGTGANRTVSHNLGAVPELMIVRNRSNAENWGVYSATIGNTKRLRLNATDAETTAAAEWNNTSPTASVFTVGTDQEVNFSGNTYVAYLFATVAGVSKVGSYTGTGTTLSIDCGFTSGARFVMIKRTDSTGDWYVWDTARGIVAGNDPYLRLNVITAEITSTDYIDPYNPGFELSSTAPVALNASGGTYIFLAIA